MHFEAGKTNAINFLADEMTLAYFGTAGDSFLTSEIVRDCLPQGEEPNTHSVLGN